MKMEIVRDEDGMGWRRSETICHGTPATVVVMAVFFCFAAIAAAVDDERVGVGDLHFGGR